MLFPPENVYERTNGALSLNASYQPSKKFKIKGNVIYHGSSLQAENFSEDTYFSNDRINRRNIHNKADNHYVSNTLQETWHPTGRFELNAFTLLNYANYSTVQNTQNEGMNTLKAMEEGQLHKYLIAQDVSANWQLGTGLLYSNVNFHFSEASGGYELSTDSNLLPIEYDLCTNANYDYFFRNATGSKEWFVSPEAGYAWSLSKAVHIKTSLSCSYARNELNYSEKKDHTDFLELNKYAANLAIEKNSGLFRFEIGTSFSGNSYHSNIAGLNSHSKGFISPHVTFQLRFSPLHTLSMNASYQLTPIEIEYLSRINRVTEYNQMYGPSEITMPFSRTTQWGVNYNFNNLFSKIHLTVTAGYTRDADWLKPCISQEEIISLTRYDNNGKKEIAYALISLNKGLGNVPIDVKWTGGYNYFYNTAQLNNMENNLSAHTLSTGLEIVSRFKSIFNGELNGTYQSNSNKTTGSEVKNDINEWSVTAKLHYAYARLKGYLYGSYTNIDNPFYDYDVYDLGFNIEYRIKKLGLKLTGNNLLHLNSLEWIGINTTPYYSSTSVYNKIPGYLQVGITYHF